MKSIHGSGCATCLTFLETLHVIKMHCQLVLCVLKETQSWSQVATSLGFNHRKEVEPKNSSVLHEYSIYLILFPPCNLTLMLLKYFMSLSWVLTTPWFHFTSYLLLHNITEKLRQSSSLKRKENSIWTRHWYSPLADFLQFSYFRRFSVACQCLTLKRSSRLTLQGKTWKPRWSHLHMFTLGVVSCMRFLL